MYNSKNKNSTTYDNESNYNSSLTGPEYSGKSQLKFGFEKIILIIIMVLGFLEIPTTFIRFVIYKEYVYGYGLATCDAFVTTIIFLVITALYVYCVCYIENLSFQKNKVKVIAASITTLRALLFIIPGIVRIMHCFMVRKSSEKSENESCLTSHITETLLLECATIAIWALELAIWIGVIIRISKDNE